MNALPSDLTFITTCKGRLAHLQQSLPLMLAQKGARIIVVDYDCPDGTAAWVRASPPTVTVVHVENTPGFVMSRARNLGAAAAITDWLAFIDADILLAPEFVDTILPLLRPNLYLRASPVSKQNWGTVICTRNKFLKAGGYDEIYRGWGTEDDDFYEALEWLGARGAGFPGALLSEVFHSDELRLRFHDAGKVTSHRINQLYRRMKFDLMNILRTPVPESQRQAMYERAREIMQALESGAQQEATVKLNLPELSYQPPDTDMPASEAGAARIARTLVYGVRISR